MHIERLLKITTAQTLAIDSLEKKIMSLSKRNIESKNELEVPTYDHKNMKNLVQKIKGPEYDREK